MFFLKQYSVLLAEVKNFVSMMSSVIQKSRFMVLRVDKYPTGSNTVKRMNPL